MGKRLGRASVCFEQEVFVESCGSVVGTKEGEGPLGDLFDQVGEEDLFGCDTWEEAESTLQKNATYIALSKGGLEVNDIRYVFGGDLLGQSMATSFGMSSYHIPLFGLYGACSTCGEALSLGAMAVAGGFGERVLCVTSSHFASAEKEFRFPLGYGNQRPLSASWTVTGSGAFVLGGREILEQQNKLHRCYGKIGGLTTGKIVDFGIKDSMNMGACMAPAAADVILQHFQDFQRSLEDYDCIVTGDLGSVGREALLALMNQAGYDLHKKHMDCGIEIYDGKKQDTHAGGSGCGCCAVTLAAFLLKELQEGRMQRILFVPTGALLSKTSFNEGKSVPGIAHAVVLESLN